MISTTVDKSASFAESRDAVLDELQAWISDCMREPAEAVGSAGHDQGTYTTSWAAYIQARRDQDPLAYMRQLRDCIRDAHVAAGRWRHGFWTMQEAHHGTEHYELFLGALHRLDPDDQETIRQHVDAAEHLGNWSEDVPAWFDWGSGLFLSQYFGADGVILGNEREVNLPDHFRCVNMALLAYDMTGKGRYLELAGAHAARWANALCESSEFPVGLGNAGPLLSYKPGDNRPDADGHRPLLGLSRIDTPVDRVESFLASGAVNSLLRLSVLLKEEPFRGAAERLLDILATQLGDPDAGPAADAVRAYQKATGDARYDEFVREAASAADPFDFSTLSMAPETRRARRPSGIGKRNDMPDWFEDDRPRRCNPILLAWAAELGSDERLAIRAVDLARAYFRLARQVYPSGQNHGCGAKSVSAIARGHGRDNNVGMITGVLAPLMAHFA